MLKLVSPKNQSRQDFELSLDEIAREGARRMLVQALNLEVEEYIQQNKHEVDKDGRRLVVRNGVSRPRMYEIRPCLTEKYYKFSFSLNAS